MFSHLHYCKVIHAYEEDIIHLHIPSCPYSKPNMFMSYTWRNTAVSIYLYIHIYVIQIWHYNWIANPSDNVLNVSYYIINGISKLSNMVKSNNCNWQALAWFVSIGKDWKERGKGRHFWISPPIGLYGKLLLLLLQIFLVRCRLRSIHDNWASEVFMCISYIIS